MMYGFTEDEDEDEEIDVAVVVKNEKKKEKKINTWMMTMTEEMNEKERKLINRGQNKQTEKQY